MTALSLSAEQALAAETASTNTLASGANTLGFTSEGFKAAFANVLAPALVVTGAVIATVVAGRWVLKKMGFINEV